MEIHHNVGSYVESRTPSVSGPQRLLQKVYEGNTLALQKVGKSVQDEEEECLIPEFAFPTCMCLWTKTNPRSFFETFGENSTNYKESFCPN